MRVLILGAGRVGTNLARLFAASAHDVALWNAWPLEDAVAAALADSPGVTVLSGRPLSLADGGPGAGFDLALVAVSDEAVPAVSRELDAAGLPASVPVLHCSGTLPAKSVRTGTHAAGRLHPAFAFPSPGLPLPVLSRICFLLEGDDAATARATRLLETCGLRFVAASPDPVLYHAACVMAANFSALLGLAAGRLMESAGIGEEEGRALLGSLMGGVLDHACREGFAASVSGPVVREDLETLLSEARAVGREAPELFSLFLEGNLTLARILGRNQLADDLTRRVEGDPNPPSTTSRGR
ncbi:MAG: DUF2520 domain-containing protein [Deltaproteobacteria bacterium]|nr:DUF2520 domain-containing protein [Deltaproteobacteria bacterium]